MKFLSLDSPFMQGMNKVADLMILNLLTLVCCIPIFTIGAAITALHYQTLKIVRDEECYVVQGYFKSFKENFKQATAIWLIFVVMLGVICGDFVIMWFSGIEVNEVIQIIIFVLGIFVLMTLTYVFPLQSKFVNTVGKTIRNALIVSIVQFPKTIVMVVANVAPLALAFFVPILAPVSLLFGFSAPAFLASLLYNKFFKKMEDKVLGTGEENAEGEENEEEDDKIFHDQLDAALQDKTFE